MPLHISKWDADGIMTKAAAVLGAYHAESGWKPYLRWNTEARTRAYNAAYFEAKAARRAANPDPNPQAEKPDA